MITVTFAIAATVRGFRLGRPSAARAAPATVARPAAAGAGSTCFRPDCKYRVSIEIHKKPYWREIQFSYVRQGEKIITSEKIMRRLEQISSEVTFRPYPWLLSYGLVFDQELINIWL